MNEQINVNDLKPGITFLKEKEVFIVIEASHSKSGRGQAHVKAKVKNLFTNSIITLTFTGGEKVEKAFVAKIVMQFLYSDEKFAHFMSTETFEQYEIERENINNKINFLIEGLSVNLLFYEEKFLDIELPKNITIRVIETASAVKGDTVSRAMKRAKLENNIEIDVPQFINVGDKIILNIENLKYVSKG